MTVKKVNSVPIWSSEKFWNGLIVAIATVTIAYFQTSTRRSVDIGVEEAKKAASAVATVKDTLADSNKTQDIKLEKIGSDTKQTLHLVNHAMEVQLEVNATQARELEEQATDPIKKAKYADLAERAEKKYKDHVANQEKWK